MGRQAAKTKGVGFVYAGHGVRQRAQLHRADCPCATWMRAKVAIDATMLQSPRHRRQAQYFGAGRPPQQPRSGARKRTKDTDNFFVTVGALTTKQ
jgi:hypothetical protein